MMRLGNCIVFACRAACKLLFLFYRFKVSNYAHYRTVAHTEFTIQFGLDHNPGLKFSYYNKIRAYRL